MFFPGSKAARAEVKNEWSCTYVSPVCFYIEGRDNFTIAYGAIENETWLNITIEI
jgi:hypothetical protein